MKTILLKTLLLTCSLTQGQKPQFISPTDYVNYLNWSTFYVCKEFHPINYTIDEHQKAAVSGIMMQFSDFNQYVIGLCETRAHYISLKSAEAGVPTFKIWLFAQNKISVFGKGLSMKSKPGFYWQYHVATAAIDKNNKVVVFDPVVNSKGPVSESDWLNAFNAPYSVYFYSCPGYFQFNSGSVDPQNVSNKLFNGKFWQLTPKNNLESLPSNNNNVSDWVNYMSVRLAANDLASKHISSTNTDFYKLISNYSKYQEWFVDASDLRFPEERKALKTYQTRYAGNLKNIDAENFKEFFYLQ